MRVLFILEERGFQWCQYSSHVLIFLLLQSLLLLEFQQRQHHHLLCFSLMTPCLLNSGLRFPSVHRLWLQSFLPQVDVGSSLQATFKSFGSNRRSSIALLHPPLKAEGFDNCLRPALWLNVTCVKSFISVRITHVYLPRHPDFRFPTPCAHWQGSG